MMTAIKGNTKNVLGRGLSALLQGYQTDMPDIDRSDSFQVINVELIAVNPCQPRKDFSVAALDELGASLQLHGMIQPITVRKLADDSYQLIAGERRMRAAKLVGLKAIPAYIRTTDDAHMLEIALIENLQREALNAIEIALSYQRLLTECSLTQETLAHRIGKDRTTVTNYLRLLKLPPDVQIALRDNKISMGHARALINLDAPETQLSVLKKIMALSLSVRDVEKLVQDLSIGSQIKKTANQTSHGAIFKAQLKETAGQLMQQLDAKVVIKADAQKQGEIKIMFDSEESLQRIVAAISNIK